MEEISPRPEAKRRAAGAGRATGLGLPGQLGTGG